MENLAWKEKVERLEAELAEANKEIKSLRFLGDALQHALWPYDKLEISLNPGTRKAPPIIRSWREFVATRVEVKKR
jgi:hypothetical protein